MYKGDAEAFEKVSERLVLVYLVQLHETNVSMLPFKVSITQCR